MIICQECKQFEKRVKQWNCTHGVIDPLPHIDDLVKPHRHLIYEGRRPDGAGGYMLTFQCLRCDQWWKISAWGLVGTLNIRPQSSIFQSSDGQTLLCELSPRKN